MKLAVSTVVLGSLIATASAQPTKAPGPPKQATGTQLPTVGETLPPNGAPGWPTKLDWLYDLPSFTDATGKVVIHWFCAPRVATCTEDLARVVTLKEQNPRVYVIAYINGSKAHAKRLDPIRESEGVGRGTVAYGRNVGRIFKTMSITGPASIVVDIDGKVALVSTGSSPPELDGRDAKVKALAAAIKDHTKTVDGPTVVKAGIKFPLTITIKLASWLKYKKTGLAFNLMGPKDIKCDHMTLKDGQLKLVANTLTAQVTCSGPKGIYELRGSITFAYSTPGGGAGMGADGAQWKFQIK